MILLVLFIQEISSEVESFLATIRECEATGHYQSPSLSIFGRTVQEKSNSVAKVLKDKKRIVKGSTDFHKNYDKVYIVMNIIHTIIILTVCVCV